jgi:hypothetical protein
MQRVAHPLRESSAIDRRLFGADRLLLMGEEKAKQQNRRLLVRLRVPSLDKMVVQVELGREYLRRCLKLMLICGKIKQTMQGAGRVTIQNHHGSYVWIFSPMSIHRLVSLARVEDWEHFSSLWVPEDFRIEGCRVLAGMRSTCTLIEDDALWFEGTDGSHLFVSVRLGREWIGRELGRSI